MVRRIFQGKSSTGSPGWEDYISLDAVRLCETEN